MKGKVRFIHSVLYNRVTTVQCTLHRSTFRYYCVPGQARGCVFGNSPGGDYFVTRYLPSLNKAYTIHTWSKSGQFLVPVISPLSVCTD